MNSPDLTVRARWLPAVLIALCVAFTGVAVLYGMVSWQPVWDNVRRNGAWWTPLAILGLAIGWLPVAFFVWVGIRTRGLVLEGDKWHVLSLTGKRIATYQSTDVGELRLHPVGRAEGFLFKGRVDITIAFADGTLVPISRWHRNVNTLPAAAIQRGVSTRTVLPAAVASGDA